MSDVRPIRGVIPILVTPFAVDDSIDYDQMAAQLAFLDGVGVSWVGFGFGSEVPRIAPTELQVLVAHAVSTVGSRIGVIGNAEIAGVRAGVEALHRVRDTGAALAMVRPAGLGQLDQQALFDTIAAVAEEGDMNLVVQDAPQNTGVVLTGATLARLLTEIPRIAALKIEPPGPAPKMSEVVQALDGSPGTIIGGAGGLDYVHELDRGAVGTMPGPAFPEVFAHVETLHREGRRAEALRTLARVLPLITLGNRDMDTFLSIQKYVLTRRGVLSGVRLRPPHRQIEATLWREVDEILDALELLPFFDTCRTGKAVTGATVQGGA